ncbi:MAG: hypothetical protein LBT50_00740 [Prevotellaceae bacterium]|jgi:hypothetical protein|nr:hypothetical protein [Prevotellaceae bacterium]
MKTQLMVILFLLPTTACVSQKREMISKSTIKLEGENTNIRNFIEIDGYYQRMDLLLEGGKMFFEDGIYVGFWFKENVTESMTSENLSQAARSWKQKGEVRLGGIWGAYRIEQDTLIGQSFQTGTFIGGGWWICAEAKYEIIDRRTLKLVYYKSLFKDDEDRYTSQYPYEVSQKNFIYKFVPADSLPTSDCWLKEKKWIWQNESDWKEYMDKLNLRKKK